ncbi:MAG TPA: ABC transporter ATP-binding protein [Chloroflexia bacterium]|nr:ABC transporter ATP-binding protein [Chloroflexia bacterium]
MTEPVLEAKKLYKSYGKHKVLTGVSFQVLPGSLVGIVGENGAGKSTLLKILAGELRPNRGEIFQGDKIGYCPQNPLLNEALTVEQHLDYFRAAYNISSLAYARELLEKLGFEKYRHTRVNNLSGGTKQKLNLTLALMHRPAVLLLDEPYQGFDWETYLRFWELASELRNQGCAVLVISHMFFEQKRFDRIYRLHEGQALPVTTSN